jgi:hypothetical protein
MPSLQDFTKAHYLKLHTLSIKLHFEPASCRLLNTIRRKYEHTPIERWGLDLLHQFLDTPSNQTLLELVLSEMAYKQPPFKVHLIKPIINPFFGTTERSINYEAFEAGREQYDITMKLQNELSERTEAAEKSTKGFRRQGTRTFRPKVNILSKLSEEEANRIVNELRTKYEDGLGAVIADGFLLGDTHEARSRSPDRPYPWKFFPFRQRESRLLHV